MENLIKQVQKYIQKAFYVLDITDPSFTPWNYINVLEVRKKENDQEHSYVSAVKSGTKVKIVKILILTDETVGMYDSILGTPKVAVVVLTHELLHIILGHLQSFNIPIKHPQLAECFSLENREVTDLILHNLKHIELTKVHTAIDYDVTTYFAKPMHEAIRDATRCIDNGIAAQLEYLWKHHRGLWGNESLFQRASTALDDTKIQEVSEEVFDSTDGAELPAEYALPEQITYASVRRKLHGYNKRILKQTVKYIKHSVKSIFDGLHTPKWQYVNDVAKLFLVKQRQRLHITVFLDVSGSMHTELARGYLRQDVALDVLNELNNPDYTVTVYPFNSTLHSPTSLKDYLQNPFKPIGGTDFGTLIPFMNGKYSTMLITDAEGEYRDELRVCNAIIVLGETPANFNHPRIFNIQL